MDLAAGIFAGLLQGVLEWLPVSSSGQSMLFYLDILGLDAERAFELGIFLHLGTMLAVLIKYRDTWANALSDSKLTRFLAITTAMTCVIGVPVYLGLKMVLKGFDGTFLNFGVGLLLVVTGFLLYYTRRKDYGSEDLSTMSDGHIALIGAVQGFTILPGISRSGATVSALALSGVNQEEALRLSFLMSVPAVAGAVVLEAAIDGIGALEPASLAGLLAAFISGYALMEMLLATAHKVRFDLFCIGFGLLAMIPLII